MSSGSSGGNPNDGRRGEGAGGGEGGGGGGGGEGGVGGEGAGGHTLAAFKYSLNTYKNLKKYWKRCEWWKWW